MQRITSDGTSARPPWTRNSFRDDPRRVRYEWSHAGPPGPPLGDYCHWREAVVDRYAQTRLPDAYVPHGLVSLSLA